MTVEPSLPAHSPIRDQSPMADPTSLMRRSLLDDLRQATRVLHRQVEARLSDGQSSWTLQHYAGLLRITHAIVQPIERLLNERLGGIFSAPPPGSRVGRLEADLHAMGAAPAAVRCELSVASDAE